MGFKGNINLIRRAVENPRNSSCGSARIDRLDFSSWWTDNSGDSGIYLHVPHRPVMGLAGTVHRVCPRDIKGYRCCRLEQTRTRLYWLYDSANAGGEGRLASSRTSPPHGSAGGGL